MAYVGRKVIAVLPVCGTEDPINTSQDEERSSSDNPPKSLFRLVEPLGFSEYDGDHDKSGEDGGKEDTLSDDSKVLAGLDSRDGSWIGEFFRSGSSQAASDHRAWSLSGEVIMWW